MIFPAVFTGLPLYYWPLLFAISLAGSIIGTYLAPPVEAATLRKFYMTVKPWGFWAPIIAEIQKEHPDFVPNKSFKRDMFNVALGIIAQLALTCLPIYLVLSLHGPLAICVAMLVVIALILKKTWWNKLEDIIGETAHHSLTAPAAPTAAAKAAQP